MKDLAWFLATHPHEWIRDPNEALKLAKQANVITQGRDIAVLATLAAAYGCDQRYSKAAFSPDSNWLVAYGRGERKLYLWRAPSWEEIEAEEKRLKSGQSP